MSEWTSEEIYTDCPYRRKWTIIIPFSIHVKIMALDQLFDTEFLVYLGGNIDSDWGRIYINDIYIPEQQVTYSSVEVEETNISHQFNGVLHKHPEGLKHFSSIDDDYINANHRFSILLEGGEYRKAIVLQRMPCGHLIQSEAIVEVKIDIDEEFEKTAKKKIKKYVSQVQTSSETLYGFVMHLKNLEEKEKEEELDEFMYFD